MDLRGISTRGLGGRAVLLLLAGLAAGPRVAAAQESTRTTGIPRAITARFEGARALTAFGTILRELSRAGLVHPVPVLNRWNSITEVLRETGRTPEGVASPRLQIYFCEQNAQACSLEKGRDGSTVARWRTTRAPEGATVEGMICGQAKLPSYALCLPDIEVFEYPTTVRVQYGPGLGLLASRVKEAGGCMPSEPACHRKLSDANLGRDVLGQEGGTLNVPVDAWGLRLRVASPAYLDNATSILDRSIQDLEKAGLVPKGAVYYTVSSPLLQKYDALPSPEDDPTPGYRQPLEAMRYPFAWVENSGLQRILVGVWDRYVDREHCDFVEPGGREAVAEHEPLDVDPADPERPVERPCGTVLSRARFDKWDHGTLVTGLIASRRNQVGVVGANPRAEVWAYEYRGDRLDTTPDPIAALGQRLSGTPKVVNMSFTEESQAHETNLQRVIRTYVDTILFVAAAGKDVGEISDRAACRLNPACLGVLDPVRYSNVVSVVPLDRDGRSLLAGGNGATPNFGPLFDVAAVGDAVGPVFGHAFAPMRGSSVAAPFVTALASLILAKEAARAVRPRQVRERILYTSDFSDELDMVVHFGRVNFERALQTDTGLLEPASAPPGGGAIRGRAVGLSSRVRIESGLLAGQPFQKRLELSQIRRITSRGDGTHWVVYLDDEGVLRKVSEARFEDGSSLRFQAAGQPAADYLIASIRDYTCSLVCQ